MSEPRRNRPSDLEAIEATAAAWLAERDGGLTPEDETTFAAWRAADPRHEAAVARLEAAWSALQSLREYRPEARAHPDTDLLQTPTRRAARRFAFPVLVSSGLAALLVVAFFWWSGLRLSRPVEAPQTYVTTADGYQRVALADGSVVELNASSEVSVSFTPAERRVRLLRGEAHFTVAKNPARPFLVDAGAVAVRAVGTAFNVRLGTRDVEVLVTEGKVDLGSSAALSATPAAAGPAEAAPAAPSAPAPTRVNANERAIVTAAEPSAPLAAPRTVVEKVEPDALREALAWQGPRLVFVDTPLAEVVSQFNRRNHVQLVLADAELATVPVGGSFRAENVDGFVRLLTSDREIVAERPDAAHIVLHRK